MAFSGMVWLGLDVAVLSGKLRHYQEWRCYGEPSVRPALGAEGLRHLTQERADNGEPWVCRFKVSDRIRK